LFILLERAAILYARLLWSQPLSMISKSTAAAFPPVTELANLAKPQDWAVWFGLDPEEKYATFPLLTILRNAPTEHPVARASAGPGDILSTLYIF
jgi:hypothetical protein